MYLLLDMLQSNIVLLTGLATGVAGTIANAWYFGAKQAFIFIGLISILVYFAYHQVVCFVKGSCLISSWFSAFLAILTFSGIGVAYYYAIQTKTQPLTNRRILEINPWILKTASYIEKEYNYNILE